MILIISVSTLLQCPIVDNVATLSSNKSHHSRIITDILCDGHILHLKTLNEI